MDIIEELRAHNRWRCGGDGPATDAKRLTMLIDAACDALEQTVWHDIATAPSDGSVFQAWLTGPGSTGWWEPRCNFGLSGRLGIWRRIESGYAFDYNLKNLKATHWMPQPSAPTPRTA